MGATRLNLEKPAQTREAFLDFLRIAACFLVIVNHTTSEVFLTRGAQERVWFVAVAYFFLSKPAVLLFYMITGYLLLGRQDTWKTAWRRILRILVVLLCCAGAYGVFYGFTSDPDHTPVQMLQSFLRVYHEPPSNALWYLYTYLGLLIMLPFLQKMAVFMEKRDYFVLFGLTCAYTGLEPILAHYDSNLTLAWQFELPLVSNAVAMAFAGQYFARFGVKKTPRGFALAGCLVGLMVLLAVWATYREYQHKGGTDYLFYDMRELTPNMIGAVCLFYMVSFLQMSPGVQKVVTFVGSCVFGMYLIGDILLDVLEPVWIFLTGRMHVLLSLVAYQMVLFVSALVIIALARRIPWVRKLI